MATTVRGASMALRAATRPCSSRCATVKARNFSSSMISCDVEAESSKAAAERQLGQGSAAGASSRAMREEEFQEDLKRLQSFRRQRAAVHIKTPFIPPEEDEEPIQPQKPTPVKAALSTLLASGAALGGAPRTVNKNFKHFIYGYRSGLAIIDLEKTLPLLRHSASLVRDIVRADGVILIVGTRSGMERCMDKAKKRLGDNGFVTSHWSPGLLTNAQTLFGVGPIESGANIPDLVIFLNPTENASGVRECTLLNVPTMAIVDSNLDPRVVTYPIPANGESLRTTELIVGALAMAGQDGLMMRRREEEMSGIKSSRRRREQASYEEEEQ